MRKKNRFSGLAVAFSVGAVTACFMPMLPLLSVVTLLLILAVLAE